MNTLDEYITLREAWRRIDDYRADKEMEKMKKEKEKKK